MKYNKIILIAIFILIAIVPTTVSAQESYTVGILSAIPEFVEGIKAGMAELGYVEGENITYIHDLSIDIPEPDLMSEAIQAMIDAKVDLIIANMTPQAALVQKLTSDIPVVFGISEEPVVAGLVESLTEPGGNITGSWNGYPNERRLQIMAEVDPTISKVCYPYDTTRPGADDHLRRIRETADKLDIEIVAVPLTDAESIPAAIENVPEDVDGLFLTTSTLSYPDFLSAWLAAGISPQAVVSWASTEEKDGILIGYGPSMVDMGQQAARIADQILQGTDPAEIPVQTVEYFLSIDLKTAAKIDLDVPRAVLRQADNIYRPGDEATPEAIP